MAYRAQTAVLLVAAVCLPAACSPTDVLPVRAYTTAEGLAHDHINRILPDSRGFLWICTDDGLSRFDGHQFVNYTTASGLPHMHVNNMLETRGGQYWIATDGGITRFHPAGMPRFVTYTPPGPPDSLHINTVVEDRDGALLLGTSAGLYRLRERAGAAPQIDPVEFGSPAGVREGSMVNALWLHGEEALWLGAKTGLYRRGTGGAWVRFSTADGLPGDFVNSFGRDREGRLWVCTRGGVGRITANPDAGKAILDLVLTVKNGLPHEDVRGIWFASDGRRWLGTIGGLVEWLPGTAAAPRFQTYLPTNGLSDVDIYGFAEDLAGNLWFGSRRGGVMRLARPQFRNYGEPAGLVLSGDETILETRGGEVCVANLSDRRRVIHCLDGAAFSKIAPRLPPEMIASVPTSHEAVFQDHLGEWWISGGHGLYRFPAVSRARELAQATPLRLLAGQAAGRLFEDSRGDLWIATGTGGFGLLRWVRAGGRFDDHAGTLPAAIATYGVNAFAEDKDGRVWFGLRQNGPLVSWRDGRFDGLAGMPPGPVNALYVDRANRLWIATGEGGLGRIDHPGEVQPAVRVYTRADGLSSNEVWCLAEDELSRLYVGTARGVDRLDPAAGLIAHYSAADGLVNGDIRAALRDHRGDLWFVSPRGVSRLNPERASTIRPPVARITSVRVLGNPLAISDLGEATIGQIEFPSNRNSIQVDFSAVEYRAPAQLRYQLRLEGTGQEWSEPASTASVNYANLAPGRYRFLVRAIDSEGLASPQPAAFGFTILQPLWRRWWIQALAGLALASAAFGWHRTRLNRLLALERMRSGIAMDLHDDIGASLARISVFSEVLKQRVSGGDSESQRMLADMAETSRTLVESMSDIVWSIDPRRDELGDVVTRIRAFGSDILPGKGIRWILDAPPDSLARKLSAEQRRQLFLILKEAIHNVAKHSHGQSASLRIRMEGDILRCEIADDGRGLAPASCTGLGLESMRARAARLGGVFEIAGRPGAEGTCAVLHVPLKAKKA